MKIQARVNLQNGRICSMDRSQEILELETGELVLTVKER